MSGECDKCGMHALECVCNDETLTTTSPFPEGLAARLLQKNLEETQFKLAFEVIEKSGMIEEFKKFYLQRQDRNVFEVMKEFGKLHPDKFYVPEETEIYAKFIKLN
jgi:hypothetical protein